MRKTIYVGPGTKEFIERQQFGDDDSFSSSLGLALARYVSILERHLPKFSESEWAVIFGALNGAWTSDPLSDLPIRFLADSVSDFIASGGAGDDVDGEALVGKLRKLDYAAKVAVVDAAERFWRVSGNSSDFAQTLRVIGVKVEQAGYA